MFNIYDFLVFMGEPVENKNRYTIAAAGVLSHVESVYGIKLSSTTTTIVRKTYDGSTIVLEESPITSINSVTIGGVEVPYTYSNNTITLDISVDTFTEASINITMGYSEIPLDLKLAIYAHIQSVVFISKENVNNVSRTVNSTGNSTYYRDTTVPTESARVYSYYSKRALAI